MAEELGLSAIQAETDACPTEDSPDFAYVVVKESFTGENEYQEPSQFNVFTDGSKMEGRTGSGFQIRQGQTEIMLSGALRCPNEATVFQAEVYAIYEAVMAIP